MGAEGCVRLLCFRPSPPKKRFPPPIPELLDVLPVPDRESVADVDIGRVLPEIDEKV